MTDSNRPRLNRRAFIGSAVAVGLAATGARLDAGEHSRERWDQEVDVVVIGSGTGLLGALVAAKSGLQVVVLEKSPTIGGTTLVSDGVVWVPNNPVMVQTGIEDSREQAMIYLERLTRGQADNELLDAFVDNGPDMLNFIASNTTIRWRISTLRGELADYHPSTTGAINRGRSLEVDYDEVADPDRHPLLGGGAILITRLAEAARKAGITILSSTPARRLLVRGTTEGRRVIGVEAEQGGKAVRIRARHGVLMASGGFERDAEMKRHFLSGPSLYTGGAETNTGDGIRMGMAVGADLRNMNSVWGITAYRADAEINGANRGGFSLCAQQEMRHPGGICVNRQGERFCNEAADCASGWRSYHTWDHWGDNNYLNIPAFQIFDHCVRRNFTIAGCAASQKLPPWVIQAETLDELSIALGINRERFAETVKTFNRFAAAGIDPEFRRGESPFGPYGGAAERTLKPLNEPPFYALEVAPADIGTCGGLRVDGSAQVIDVFGRPITGLYASGNTAGTGDPGALNGRTGGTLGPAFTFAYIAGKSLAGAKSQIT